jgi:hypothetical protein
MKRQLSIFLAMTLMICACREPGAATPASSASPTSAAGPTPTDKPLPTVTPACISSKPTEEDVAQALHFGADVFDSPDWEKSYSISETTVAVTRQNVQKGAVVYVQAIIFPCMYEELDLNNYYSEKNWNAIFSNYESHEALAECKTDNGLRLYQFKTQNQGLEYEINYWVVNDTDTRVISTMLVFPVNEQVLLSDYSARLFPDLPNCS